MGNSIYTKYGKNKLLASSMMSENDSLQILKNENIDINLIDILNRTAFLISCKNSMYKLMSKLITYKNIKIGLPSTLNETELLFCSKYSNNKYNYIYKFIINKITDNEYFIYSDLNKNSAIMNFINFKNIEIVNLLLKKQLKFDNINTKYQNILHLLIINNLIKSVKLLNIKKFINQQDKYGNTPLLYLLQNYNNCDEYYILLNQLLINGSNLLLKNINKKSGIDYIVLNNDLFIYFLKILNRNIIIKNINCNEIINYCDLYNEKYNIIKSLIIHNMYKNNGYNTSALGNNK